MVGLGYYKFCKTLVVLKTSALLTLNLSIHSDSKPNETVFNLTLDYLLPPFIQIISQNTTTRFEEVIDSLHLKYKVIIILVLPLLVNSFSSEISTLTAYCSANIEVVKIIALKQAVIACLSFISLFYFNYLMVDFFQLFNWWA